MQLNRDDRHNHWIKKREIHEHEELLRLERMSEEFIDDVLRHDKSVFSPHRFRTGHEYSDNGYELQLGDIVEVANSYGCDTYKGIVVDCVRIPPDGFRQKEETICVKVRNEDGYELWDAIAYLTRIQGSKADYWTAVFEKGTFCPLVNGKCNASCVMVSQGGCLLAESAKALRNLSELQIDCDGRASVIAEDLHAVHEGERSRQRDVGGFNIE